MADAELAFAGMAGQREALRRGELTPRELVEICLRRIERLDPRLNSFRRVFAEEALREADLALGSLRGGDERPLLGLPVAIKDNVAVAGDVTTLGTRGFGAPAASDCEVVRRVREAGAIVVGRTHVPPLALGAWTESTAWGITTNPWDMALTPGGSSGGSAAAVAAGLVPFALAADAGGSLRLPAAFCGLFGLKPQRGRLPWAPLSEHWYGMDVLGWVTRGTLDAAIVYDATLRTTDDHPQQRFLEAARRDPGRLRIAWSSELPPPAKLIARVDEHIKSAVTATAELFERLGHEVVERTPDYPQTLSAACAARILAGIAADLADLPQRDRLERRDRVAASIGRLLAARGLIRARAAEPRLSARLNAIFDSIDVLLLPVAPTLPFAAGRYQGRGFIPTWLASGTHFAFTLPWNYTGQPAAAVPAGYTDDGLPLAVQLIARPHDETTLIALAAQLEACRPWTDHRPAAFT